MVSVDGVDLLLRDRNLRPESVEAEFVVGFGVIEGDDPLIYVVYVPVFPCKSKPLGLIPRSAEPKAKTSY